jgi:general secretion pathway protein J
MNRRTEIRNPESNGFTLLEVLIATAIMAGIVTVIYTSFFTASQNVEQAEEMRDSSDLVRTLVAKISNDIENAYVNPGMEPLTVFYGKKVQGEPGEEKIRYDELYLTTLTNWRRPGTKETDLWEVGYYFKQKPDGSGYVMLRREKRELNKDVPALEGGVEYEMTDRVASLQFRYYDGSSWSDEWNNKTVLPKAMEISLLLTDGSDYITKVDVGR